MEPACEPFDYMVGRDMFKGITSCFICCSHVNNRGIMLCGDIVFHMHRIAQDSTVCWLHT
jgi:hypothetical protein